jgi:hypothetical protein
MKIDKYYAYKIMADAIEAYLQCRIDKYKIPEQLGYKISPMDASESEDLLFVESFFTIFHLDEVGCDAPKEELEYLRDCLVGEKVFSRELRDEIIMRISCVSKAGAGGAE